MLTGLSPICTVVKEAGLDFPETKAAVMEVDFKANKIKSSDWALAALSVLAGLGKILTKTMLTAALKLRFNQKTFEMALSTTQKFAA
jgi:hypothetical protein